MTVTQRQPPTSDAAHVALPQGHFSPTTGVDRRLHAAIARVTRGLSPAAISVAWIDWGLHLLASPEKQSFLMAQAVEKSALLQTWLRSTAWSPQARTRVIDPLPQDHRFDAEAWSGWPFNVSAQAFQLTQQWWHHATTGVRGVDPADARIVEFMARQALDIMAPSNSVLTNPEVLAHTIQEGGANLIRGWQNWLEDVARHARGEPPAGAEAFRIGHEVAATPGKVIYRNRLIELIQYAPSTGAVRPEPIMIVPAWIMKYYILDLSTENSLIRWLVGQGFTVFAISWKNPTSRDRDTGFEDYHRLGVMAAMDAATAITGAKQVHGIGYCLGGTLLSIAAAAMARDGDDRLATLSLFAAQTDFTEAGEIRLFINESQVAFLEDMMAEQGYLDASQMAGAFQMLRSNDLIWSRMVREYLMGQRTPVTDLMAWNADPTRMPARMHSEYLRQLFLNNDFAEGRMKVGGSVVAVSDIRAPVFAVGTEWDHVAPWRSVYKLHMLADTDITFVLTNGGHNAGIVSEPGHPHRHYRIATRHERAPFTEPDRWMDETPVQDGSWWPAFAKWLGAHSGDPVPPPPMGAAKMGYKVLCDAPGSYVTRT